MHSWWVAIPMVTNSTTLVNIAEDLAAKETTSLAAFTERVPRSFATQVPRKILAARATGSIEFIWEKAVGHRIGIDRGSAVLANGNQS
jgi:hypothetical protein